MRPIKSLRVLDTYSVPAPALAQSSSCWLVPPPTPQAPSTTPSRTMGTAPWPPGIMCPPAAAAMPRGVAASGEMSPLGRPNAADATALPCGTQRAGPATTPSPDAPRDSVHATECLESPTGVYHRNAYLDVELVRLRYSCLNDSICFRHGKSHMMTSLVSFSGTPIIQHQFTNGNRDRI